MQALESPPIQCPELVRPSLLDPLLLGDPWVARCKSGDYLVMYLNNCPIFLLPGYCLDQWTLNSYLFEMRTRPARRS